MNAKGSVELVSAPFRAEHEALREQLRHAGRHIGRLAYAGPSEQRRLMVKVLRLVRQHVMPHARWEEEVLYPAVDAGAGTRDATAALVHQHRVIARWLDELDRLAERRDPDGRIFARKADQLLGLILAHLEGEEEILLPILDRTMTPAQFDRDVMLRPRGASRTAIH